MLLKVYNKFLLNIFLLLLILSIFVVHASPFGARFERISREQGLSHTTVYDINQDSHGYIWVGTGDGLNRFDGYSFKVFRNVVGDDKSLSNNRVMVIYEDSQQQLWIGTRGGGLNRFDKQSDSFVRYRFSSEDESSLSNDDVRAIFEDSSGNLWVGTRNGLNLFDPQSNRFTRFVHDKSDAYSLSHNRISALEEHSSGKLWVATLGGGLNLFDQQSGRFDHFRYKRDDASSLSSDRIYTLHYDQNDRLWIGTLDDGLNRLDKRSQTFVRYPYADGSTNSLSHGRVLSIVDDYLGRIWIGTYGGGINRLDPNTGKIHEYRSNGLDNTSISSNRIHKVFADVNGEIWVGTASGGLNKHNIRSERFGHVYRNAEVPNTLSLNSVSALFVQRDGTLWVGTFGGGLNRFDTQQGGFVYYKRDENQPGSISDNNVRDIIEDQKGNLWVSTFGGGLNYYDSATDKFTVFKHQQDLSTSISSNSLSSLLIDENQVLWVGTSNGGLNRFDAQTGHFKSFEHDTRDNRSISSNNVVSLYQDSDGIIWIGTSGGGLNRFESKTEQFTHYRHNPADSQSLSHDVVLSIIEDSQNRMWIGSRGGFNRFFRHTGKFERYGISEGLVNDVVHGMLPDANGNLWFSTNDGLSQFNPVDKSFRHYRSKDGLQSNEFNRHAYFKSEQGELFFGGINGFNRFFPTTIVEDSKLPPVVLTEFRLFNQPVEVGVVNDEDGVFKIDQPIDQLKALELDYGQNLVSFEFSALHFTDPSSNLFAYMLEGWDKEWIMTDAKNRRATYTNIPPGHYVLRIKASNHYGHWNEEGKSLPIRIFPSKWETWWAYTLYCLFTLLLIYWFFRTQRRRLRDMRRLNLQLKQVDKLKDEFLANTSHELRTPLNGIIGLAESLMDGVTGQLPARTNANLAMIVASGKRLSNLVNDILDFSKLKNRNLVIYPKPVDLHTMADVVLALSKPLVSGKNAEDKDVVLANNVPHGLPAVMADEDRLQQILHNLVDNGIKFTECGQVTVSAIKLDGMLKISVSDTGIGIERNKFDTIFESFEQVQSMADSDYSGTGLGLSVSRQLVELHGGQLHVESELRVGTTFSFTLPMAADIPAVNIYAEQSVARLHYLQQVQQEAQDEDLEQEQWLDNLAEEHDVIHQTQQSQVEVDSTDKGLGKQVINTKYVHDCSKFRILLVDDEPVNRQVLHNHLSVRNYRLVEASGGQQALKLVEEQGPFDLILLDIMMPNMSGYEVCKKLRQHYAVNDLPIIFLTAKNQVADLVQSFAVGANDFLTKPVSKYELLKRVETHLRLLDINRHLEQKITERTTELVHAEKMASLGTLTAGVAHEINNPTNFVHVSVKTLGRNLNEFRRVLMELVTDEAEDSLVKDFERRFADFTDDISTIVEGTGRIRDIVTDLQSFTQLDAELKTTVVITDCLSSAINLVRTQNADVANFYSEFHDNPELLCYPAQLNQLFMNLIVNACDAIRAEMPVISEKVTGEVRIVCRVQEPWVVITINDNGVGMTDETKSRLFEPFYTTKDIGEGTGLGLSIAYGIVNKHGGEITIESALNSGSQVTLFLPLTGLADVPLDGENAPKTGNAAL